KLPRSRIAVPAKLGSRKLAKRRSRFATRQIPRGRTQRRERPAAKRSNLLAATNMRCSARRQIGPLSPDARLGAPVNRVATKIRGQHRPGVASGVQMNTSHPQIPLPVGQIAKQTVQQTDGENATRTIISRRVLRSAGELAARARGGRPLAGPGGGAHLELAPRPLWRLSAQR